MANKNKTYSPVFTHALQVLAISLLLAGLAVISIVSYAQTEMVFRVANDSSTSLFGINFGAFLSHAFAMLFQYGQNAALLYRVFAPNMFPNRFRFSLVKHGKKFTDLDIALWVFILFALIDAGSNCLWLYDVRAASKAVAVSQGTFDPLRFFISGTVLYIAMAFVVLIEEALGLVLDIWKAAYSNFQSALLDSRRSSNASSRSSSGNFPSVGNNSGFPRASQQIGNNRNNSAFPRQQPNIGNRNNAQNGVPGRGSMSTGSNSRLNDILRSPQMSLESMFDDE